MDRIRLTQNQKRLKPHTSASPWITEHRHARTCFWTFIFSEEVSVLEVDPIFTDSLPEEQLLNKTFQCTQYTYSGSRWTLNLFSFQIWKWCSPKSTHWYWSMCKCNASKFSWKIENIIRELDFRFLIWERLGSFEWRGFFLTETTNSEDEQTSSSL